MTQNANQPDAEAYREPVGATNGKIAAAAPLRRRRPLLTRLLAAVFAALTVVVCVAGLGAARLAMGPVSLNWLVPLVQEAASKHSGPVKIALRQASLTWRDWAEGPTLSVGKVQATDAGGAFDVRIDALSASLSVPSLLAGQPVPGRLSASGVQVTALLPPATGTAADIGGVPSIADVFNAGPLQFIDAISISDAAVALARAPGEVIWQGRIETMAIIRGAGGLEGDATLSLDQGGAPGGATLAVRSDAATATTNAALLFTGLRLAALAPLAPALAPLVIADIPLSGNASAVLGADGSLQSVTLTATGENGRLALTPELAKGFGIADAAQDIPLRSLSLQVSGQPAAQTWSVDQLQLRLPDTAIVALPAPVGKKIPLREINGRATFNNGRLSVPALDIALDQPRFSVTADISDVTSVANGTVQVTMRDVTVPMVHAYWPPQMAANAYDWVKAHLVAGNVREATMQMSLGAADGAPTVTALQLTIPVEDAVVDYLPPLPPVRQGRGVVVIDLKSLTVNVEQALVDGLTVFDGRVVIPDFDADVSTIDIDFATRGSVPDMIRILSTKPIDFVSGIDLRPENTGGRFDGRVRLGFPLLDELDVAQIKVFVAATTESASARFPSPKVALTDGNLRFAVTESGLHAAGSLAVDGVRGLLDWNEDFEFTTPLRRSIDFRIANAAVAAVRKSLAKQVVLDPYLKGGQFDGVVRYTERDDGNASVDATLELTDAAVVIPELRWHKPAGQIASAQAQASLVSGKLTAIRSLRLAGGDADVHGSALFTDAGDLRSVYLDPFILGRSHLTATIHNMDGKGWDVTLTGRSLDIAPFVDGSGEADDRAGAKPSGQDPNLIISADIEKAWINGDEPLQGVLVSAMRRDGAWQFVQVRGQTMAGSAFSVEMQPSEDNLSSIAVSAQDAGATLAALGLYTNLRGGTLTGQATGILSEDKIQLSGELRVNRFFLVGAPLLARMLDVLAVTGLRDVLTGRGISFWSLRVPFEIRDGVIELKNARASGASLGMTGAGTIDLDQSLVNLSGTLIPFYWANSALGNLPIIGNWLTGGETGGGLFSATYQLSGSLDDPKLAVNPYSFVLPSVIRYILELIQDWIGPRTNGDLTAAGAAAAP